ncbi:hypothetical protein AK88_05366, partial [Plasmodium fragile]
MDRMEALMDALGSNCDNAGWQHWLTHAKHAHVGHNEGDRIACRLMTLASYFLEGWSHTARLDDDDNTNNMKLKGYMRCAVVHMFSEILNESECRSKWGTFYGWYSVQGMMTEGGITKSAGMPQCEMYRLLDITRGNWSMSQEIKERLRNNDGLQSMLERHQEKSTCHNTIRKEKKKKSTPLDANRQTDKASGNIEVQETLKRELKRVLKKVEREISVKGANDPDEKDSDGEETLSEDDEADEPNKEIAGGKYTNSNNTNTNTQTPGAGGPAARKPAVTKPQAPASPVLPARPPPPPPGPPPSPPTPTKEGTDAHSPPSKADSSAEGTSQGKGKTLRDSKKKPEENKEKCSEDETDHDKVFDCLQKQEDLANAGTGVNQPDGSEKYDGKGPVGVHGASRSIEVSAGTSFTAPVVPPGEATTVDSTTDATQPDKSNQAGYNPKDVNPVASTNEDEAKEKPNQENEQKEGAKAADTAGKDVSSVKQPNTEKSSPCSGISDDEYDTGRCGFTLFDKSSPQCPNGPDSTSPGNSAGGVGSTQIQNPGSSGPGSTAVSGDGSSHTGTRGGQQGDSASSSSNFGLPNFDLANMIPKGPNVPGGGFVPLKREHVTLNEDNEKLMKQGPPSHGGPDGPDLTAD